MAAAIERWDTVQESGVEEPEVGVEEMSSAVEAVTEGYVREGEVLHLDETTKQEFKEAFAEAMNVLVQGSKTDKSGEAEGGAQDDQETQAEAARETSGAAAPESVVPLPVKLEEVKNKLGISQSDVFVDAPSEEEDEGDDAEAHSVGQGLGQNDKEVVQPAAIPVEQEEVETEFSAVDEAAGLGGPADVAQEEEEEYAAAMEELGEEEEKPEEKEEEDKLAEEGEEEGVPVEKGFAIPEAIVLAEPSPAPMSPEEHRMWAGVSLCLSLYLPAYVLFKAPVWSTWAIMWAVGMAAAFAALAVRLARLGGLMDILHDYHEEEQEMATASEAPVTADDEEGEEPVVVKEEEEPVVEEALRPSEPEPAMGLTNIKEEEEQVQEEEEGAAIAADPAPATNPIVPNTPASTAAPATVPVEAPTSAKEAVTASSSTSAASSHRPTLTISVSTPTATTPSSSHEGASEEGRLLATTEDMEQAVNAPAAARSVVAMPEMVRPKAVEQPVKKAPVVREVEGPAYGEAGSSSAPSRPVQAVATTRPQQEAVVASKPPHKRNKWLSPKGFSGVHLKLPFGREKSK